MTEGLLIFVCIAALSRCTVGQDLFLEEVNGSSSDPSQDPLFMDQVRYWNLFRDDETGLWCDSVGFGNAAACGEGNNRYSSAGTGMGLVSDCVLAELKILSQEEARRRTIQTISNVLDSWPREEFHGFFVHWTNRQYAQNMGEYSTVDTAELTAGALFAGNYFGGTIAIAAAKLFNLTDWSQAVKGANDSTIFPMVNALTGAMIGDIRPFNEYFIVAYLALLQAPETGSKASRYFQKFFGMSGSPPGDGTYPKSKSYGGYTLLTDQDAFVSSFIPQFCWFLTRGFHENTFYANSLFPAWLRADMLYWNNILLDSSEVWGHPVKSRVWGCGAGESPTGYGVEQINSSADLTFSAAIMAGFLGAADGELRSLIAAQLRYLYDNGICAYERQLPSGTSAKVLWRCSVAKPTWRAHAADSIDFSTMVLGYAVQYLPAVFYSRYAAGSETSDSGIWV